jgi:hypothetical protein
MQHSNTANASGGTAGAKGPPGLAKATPLAPIPAAQNVDALRARNASLREGVSSQLQGLGAEMCQSLLRHADVEAVADFAHGDDDYAAAPGIANAIITQLKCVEGILQLPSAEGSALDIERYYTNVIDFMIELCAPTNSFFTIFPSGRKSFSLVINGGVYTHQVRAAMAVDYLDLGVPLVAGQGQFLLHFAEGPRAQLSFNMAWVVDEKKGRKIVPAAVAIRALHEQSGKPLSVHYKKKIHPGKLLIAGDFTESEIAVIKAHPAQLHGDVEPPFIAFDPNAEDIEIFIEPNNANSVKAFNSIIAPQLAGKLRVPLVQLRTSKVPQSVVQRGFNIMQVQFPYSEDASDRAFVMAQLDVHRMLHPRAPEAGGFLIRVAGSLAELQARLGSRLLKPTAQEAPEEEDDGTPMILSPTTSPLSPAMLGLAGTGNAAGGAATGSPGDATARPSATASGGVPVKPPARASTPATAAGPLPASPAFAVETPTPRTPTQSILGHTLVANPRTGRIFTAEMEYVTFILGANDDERAQYPHFWEGAATARCRAWLDLQMHEKAADDASSAEAKPAAAAAIQA